MFELTGTPISITDGLPAGAYKLYVAAQEEPRATQERYARLIGYSERSVRLFTAALVEAGLARRIEPQARLADADQELTRRLIEFGVAPQKARALAAQYPAETIRVGMEEARQKPGVRNPPGYLIWWLLSHAPVKGKQSAQDAGPWGTTVPEETTTDAVTVAPDANNTHHGGGGYNAHGARADESAAATSSASSASAADAFAEKPSADVALVPAPEAAEEADPAGIPVTEENREALLIGYAIQEATGSDLRLNAEARSAAETLYHAGYTADDVAQFAEQIWPRKDWRGQKGERVTLASLMDGIALVLSRRHARLGMPGGLIDRVELIRAYLPRGYRIRTLSDLWNETVEDAAWAHDQAVHEQAQESFLRLALGPGNRAV